MAPRPAATRFISAAAAAFFLFISFPRCEQIALKPGGVSDRLAGVGDAAGDSRFFTLPPPQTKLKARRKAALWQCRPLATVFIRRNGVCGWRDSIHLKPPDD
jgi:hypothetical protein